MRTRLMTSLIAGGTMAWLTTAALAQPAPQPRPAGPQVPTAEAGGPRIKPGTPPLILISIDGFRADYLDRGYSPNLKALADGGATGEMHPSFPSLTFPNHYTLVTGLFPDHHGIVENTMTDTARPGVVFKMSNADAVQDRFWWDGATPMWDTVERAGGKTGVEFWPGSEADEQSLRPTYYTHFDNKVTYEARVDQILAWMDLPADQRPNAYLLYFDTVDHNGHDFGPDSKEVDDAITTVDQAIGRLEAGLKARGIRANQIVVADHGMSQISPDRAYFLEDILPAGSYDIKTTGPVASLNPVPGHEAEIDAKLVNAHFDHMQCWHKAQIPARLHYGTHPRIPEIVCLADQRWLVDDTHAKGIGYKAGAHGYDNLAPDMQALFVANGPAFRSNVMVRPFFNVDVYDLEMKVLGLTPEPNDGSLFSMKAALK